MLRKLCDQAMTAHGEALLIEDALVVLHPLDMVFVAIDQLGEHVMSLIERGQAIAAPQ